MGSMIVYEKEISKLKLELADKGDKFNELKEQLNKEKSKALGSTSFFGGINDVSLFSSASFINSPVTKLKSPAKQQIASPAFRLKNIINETVWNNKEVEIENLKSQLQSVMETLEFHEMEKFTIIEEQKVILSNLKQQLEEKQISSDKDSKVKSYDKDKQIDSLESEIRLLKDQIKEQKLNFAETFGPTNETEKKDISELMEIVER